MGRLLFLFVLRRSVHHFIRIVAVDVVRQLADREFEVNVVAEGRSRAVRNVVHGVVDVEFVGGELVSNLDLRDVRVLGVSLRLLRKSGTG